MATPQWWSNWDVGSYNETLSPLQFINALIPYMRGAEQNQAAQYLYGQRAADATLANWLSGYNQSGATAPSTQADYLKSIGQASKATLPSYQDSSSPEKNWMDTLLASGKQLRPGMSREQQQSWKDSYDALVGQAPNDTMKALAGYLYNPTLTRPDYGSAANLGTYTQAYRTKGGLVSNPYYSS